MQSHTFILLLLWKTLTNIPFSQGKPGVSSLTMCYYGLQLPIRPSNELISKFTHSILRTGQIEGRAIKKAFAEFYSNVGKSRLWRLSYHLVSKGKVANLSMTWLTQITVYRKTQYLSLLVIHWIFLIFRYHFRLFSCHFDSLRLSLI